MTRRALQISGAALAFCALSGSLAVAQEGLLERGGTMLSERFEESRNAALEAFEPLLSANLLDCVRNTDPVIGDRQVDILGWKDAVVACAYPDEGELPTVEAFLAGMVVGMVVTGMVLL